MKPTLSWTAALLFVSGLAASPALAQKGVGDTTGIARQAARPEIVTMSGTVTTIKIEPCEKTTGPSVSGTHVLLRDADEKVWNLHLGPTVEVKYAAKELVVGQEVSATLFRTNKLPEDNYVVQTLTIGDTPIRLRDENLRPLWANQGPAKRGTDRPRGQGRGQGYGQGRGQSRGQGLGQGGGQGRGQGFGQGRGQGRGQGLGQGGGQGRGQGFGQGRGQGLGQGGGQGRGQGRGQGFGQGGGQGRGQGIGQGCTQGRCPGRGEPGGRCNGSECALFSAETLSDLETKGPLKESEAAGLIALREEEKLAHDVYVALAAKWQEPIFANISQAESRHMEAMARLLKAYQLDDPVGNLKAGEFFSPRFAALYKDLVEAGSGSLAQAYQVGARIEELDISDLQDVTAASTQPLVKQVFANLERASRNHLRAFAARLAAEGETYEASHLTQEEFDAIAKSDWERGHSGGSRGGPSGRGPGWGRGSGPDNMPRQGRGSGGGRGRGQGRGQGHGQGRGAI